LDLPSYSLRVKIKASIGVSREKDYGLAAKEALAQAKADMPYKKFDLAFVFASIDLCYPSLLKTIVSELGHVPLIGSSGAAVITNHGILKHGVAVLLLNLPERIFFNVACVSDVKTKTPVSAGEELGTKLLYGFKDVRRDLSVVFSDGLIKDSHGLIRGLQAKLGSSFPLVGASASDNLSFTKTCVFFNQEMLTDAAAGILWGGRLNFGLGTSHGWKPLGKPRRVTKSYNNAVYTIDGLPAAKVYEEYLGRDFNELKKELKHISTLYPVGIYLSEEEEYLLRNVVAIDEGGILVFQGDVPQASQIRLMIATKESCLLATREALNEANAAVKQPDFLLVFNSISRYILLGRDASKELRIIKGSVPENTPIAGVYTYGEQAPLKAINYQGKVYFHDQTIAVLSVGD
jgi:hypothetical protein